MFEFKKRDPTELPFDVLENAHWRPGDAQLCCKYKPQERKGKEYLRLQNHWTNKEAIFNFSLDSLLMSLTATERGKLASTVSGLKFSDSTDLYGGYSHALKRVIGVPDFILSDGKTALLAEIKLGAKYTYPQFVKYLSFAMLTRAAENLPDKVAHVVIVRDRSTCLNKSGWQPVIDSGSGMLTETGRDKEIAKTLAKNALNLARIYGIGFRFLNSLQESLKVELPVRILEWNEFTEMIDRSTKRAEIHQYSANLLNRANGEPYIEPHKF